MINDATNAPADFPSFRDGVRKRPTLTLSRNADPARSGATLAALEIIRRAIIGRHGIAAVYNKGTVQLAPYILFERREGLFVDGLVLGRNEVAPAEAKIGSFKLAGLTAVDIAGQSSPAHPVFDRNALKYDGTTLLVIAD